MNQTEEELESVECIKQKGNDALKQGNYVESIFHYTRAIKKDPNNYSLYSNRSYAFLKAQQYYFALEDAKETIKLNPDWPKGHFRKAEVEYSTYRFADAIQSYREALCRKHGDCDILHALERTQKDWIKDQRADDQIPWLGAGIGIVLGVIIVIADFICTTKPSLNHPILMAALTISVAMMGYGLAKACRYYVKCQRNGLLEVPLYLEDKETKSETEDTPATEETKPERNRYTKTQARYRYKKGKL